MFRPEQSLVVCLARGVGRSVKGLGRAYRSNIARAIGTTHAITQPRADLSRRRYASVPIKPTRSEDLPRPRRGPLHHGRSRSLRQIVRRPAHLGPSHPRRPHPTRRPSVAGKSLPNLERPQHVRPHQAGLPHRHERRGLTSSMRPATAAAHRRWGSPEPSSISALGESWRSRGSTCGQSGSDESRSAFPLTWALHTSTEESCRASTK